MTRRILKNFLSFILMAAMLLSMVPAVTITASAATSGEVTGLTNDNVGLSFSGDKEDTWSANGTTVTGSIQSSSGCGTTHYSSTLTLTNKRSIPAVLSFDYAIDLQGGTIQVDGTAVTAGGTFSKEDRRRRDGKCIHQVQQHQRTYQDYADQYCAVCQC